MPPTYSPTKAETLRLLESFYDSFLFWKSLSWWYSLDTFSWIPGKKMAEKNQFVKSLPRPGCPQKVLLPYPAPRNMFLETVLKLDRLMQFCVDLDFQVNKEHSVEKHLSSLVAHSFYRMSKCLLLHKNNRRFWILCEVGIIALTNHIYLITKLIISVDESKHS